MMTTLPAASRKPVQLPARPDRTPRCDADRLRLAKATLEHRIHRRPASAQHVLEMFGMPMFDLHDAAGMMLELASCRQTFPALHPADGIRLTRKHREHLHELHRQPAGQGSWLRLTRRRSTAARCATPVHSYATASPKRALRR